MRKHLLLAAIACAALALAAAPAWGKTQFRPRIGGALGLFPPYTGNGTFGAQDVAPGALTPVTYHGDSVMTGGITVHTIFWAPPGYSFQGSPGAGIPTYVGMIQQFFTDVAAGSTGTAGGPCTTASCNMFTVEPQFAQGLTPGTVTPGQNTVAYSTSTDSITDTDPYPPVSQQCASPQNTAVCITDPELQAEVDHVINTTGGNRGLHDIWYVFTPPGVDECISAGVCETNAYGGYHSLSKFEQNKPVTIYAFTGDPIVESTTVNEPGSDPEGFPDAEVVVDIAAHETNEAMTDPEGVGYMDPNGFEIGDKCEFGPQYGTPLGFAPDGSPYNQVINGHKYLIQEMWANHDNSGNSNCVQATTTTTNDLPLPQVSMTQFSQTVSGNTEVPSSGGGTVTVSLLRNDPSGTVTVAHGTGTIAADGSWGPVSLAPHAVGDDRDEVDIDYSGPGSPAVSHQVILTGNGGNPFTESGWTGWTDMDNGSCLTNNNGGPCLTGNDFGSSSLTLGPCFQTGVESTNAFPSESPTDFCSTQLDSATVPLSTVTPSDAFTWSSLDNRAFQDPNLPTANPTGALVSLTVPIGEADAVSTFANPLATFTPTGFPTCAADLEAQSVTCSGLVSGSTYSMTDNRTGTSHSATANGAGGATATFATGTLPRGDQIALSNGSRTLTTLHIANLRVDVTGEQSVLSGGSCSAGQYFNPPLNSAPTNASAGTPTALAGGSALTGTACPSSGSAAGFPSSPIAQTDELSGGSTQTEVPDVENTSPMEGEGVYGKFVALAESGLPGPFNTTMPTDSTSTIAVSIAPAAGGAPVFTSPNVDTPNGVTVKGLKAGSYKATWTLTDANGDTRTVTTRFIEETSPKTKGHKPKVNCKTVSHGKKIKCTVTYRKSDKVKGKLQMRLTHGGKTVALGHGRVRNSKATLRLGVIKHVAHGKWAATLVLTNSSGTTTTHVKVHMT